MFGSGFQARPVGGAVESGGLDRQLAEIQRLLAGLEPFTRGRQQQGKLGIGVGGADMLDIHHLAVVLDHQMDRDRP